MANSNLLSLILVLVSCSSAFVHAAAPSKCHKDDLGALLDLQASITRDPSKLLSSWNDTVDCCSWDGISFDNATGSVVSLERPGARGHRNGWHGRIPASISRLPHPQPEESQTPLWHHSSFHRPTHFAGPPSTRHKQSHRPHSIHIRQSQESAVARTQLQQIARPNPSINLFVAR